MTFRWEAIIMLLTLPGLGAADGPKSGTPAEEYQALIDEHQKALTDFFKRLEAKSDEERTKFLKEMPDFSPKFLTLAQKHPKDAVALDALVWIVNNPTPGSNAKDDVLEKALDLLLKDHLQSERLADVCERLAWSPSEKAAETFLRTLLDKSKHKEVQAVACLTLAQQPLERARMVEAVKKNAEEERDFLEFLGKDYVEALKKEDPDKLRAAAAVQFRRFIDDYSASTPPKRMLQLLMSLQLATDKVSEEAVRGLREKDARPEVRGPATLTLARLLSGRAEKLTDKEAKEAGRLLEESKALLVEAAKKFADVKLEFGDTVGKKAESQLFSLENLRVGKTAPDIEGEDQDGKRFKLSDYRGKVVLLDFWNEH